MTFALDVPGGSCHPTRQTAVHHLELLEFPKHHQGDSGPSGNLAPATECDEAKIEAETFKEQGNLHYAKKDYNEVTTITQKP